MSEAQTTQTAVDTTTAPAQQGATVESARNDGDDLDKLLSEYDESGRARAAPAAQPEQTGATSDLKALADEVRELRTDRQKETFRKDMDGMVKNVRGDLNPEFFDDTFVEAWVDAQARQDRRLLQAFADRHTNPKQFQKVVDTLGRSFHKRYSKLPDRNATEDREAVTAAVRGASTRAPEGQAPNYAGMSDSQFQQEKDKAFGG